MNAAQGSIYIYIFSPQKIETSPRKVYVQENNFSNESNILVMYVMQLFDTQSFIANYCKNLGIVY